MANMSAHRQPLLTIRRIESPATGFLPICSLAFGPPTTSHHSCCPSRDPRVLRKYETSAVNA